MRHIVCRVSPRHAREDVPLFRRHRRLAVRLTEQETARETLEKNSKAHDDTLNHITDGVAIFGADRKLIFNNPRLPGNGSLIRLPADRRTHGSCSIACVSVASFRRARISPGVRQGELAYYKGEKVDIVEDLWNIPDGRILRVTRQRHPLAACCCCSRTSLTNSR